MAMFEKVTAREGLPSLNSLRAFEAMARTGGATAAGLELGVTHSAVSRQVKALERRLGAPLFEGPRHALILTAEGRRLAAGLGEGFDRLERAVRDVRGRQDVRLAVHPSLAVKWLIPRLARFEFDLPDVNLILSDLPPEATRQRGADLLLRYMARDAAGSQTVVLADNRIGPVCAPRLLEDGLERAPRLSARTHPRGWTDWQAAGGAETAGGPVRVLNHLHFVLDAALAGLGMAVLPETLTAEDIGASRLAAPFGFRPDGGVLAAILMDAEPAAALRRTLAWLKTAASGDQPAVETSATAASASATR